MDSGNPDIDYFTDTGSSGSPNQSYTGIGDIFKTAVGGVGSYFNSTNTAELSKLSAKQQAALAAQNTKSQTTLWLGIFIALALIVGAVIFARRK